MKRRNFILCGLPTAGICVEEKSNHPSEGALRGVLLDAKIIKETFIQGRGFSLNATITNHSGKLIKIYNPFTYYNQTAWNLVYLYENSAEVRFKLVNTSDGGGGRWDEVSIKEGESISGSLDVNHISWSGPALIGDGSATKLKLEIDFLPSPLATSMQLWTGHLESQILDITLPLSEIFPSKIGPEISDY